MVLTLLGAGAALATIVGVCVTLFVLSRNLGKERAAAAAAEEQREVTRREAEAERERERREADAKRDAKLLQITEVLGGRRPTAFDPNPPPGIIQQLELHTKNDAALFEKVAKRLDEGDARMARIESRLA